MSFVPPRGACDFHGTMWLGTGMRTLKSGHIKNQT